MHTYVLYTDGIPTHQGEGPSVEEAAFFPIPKRTGPPTGPRARQNKEIVCVGVDEKAERVLGAACPKLGQRFPTLAAAAKAIGCKNPMTLYQSRRHANRMASDTYKLYGVEFGFAVSHPEFKEPVLLTVVPEEPRTES